MITPTEIFADQLEAMDKKKAEAQQRQIKAVLQLAEQTVIYSDHPKAVLPKQASFML